MIATLKAFFTINALRVAAWCMAALSFLGILLAAHRAGRNAERVDALETQSENVRKSHEVQDKNAALFLMATLLNACAMNGRVTDSFCAIGRPIYISKQDSLTDVTARQILDHNEVGKVLCGW